MESLRIPSPDLLIGRKTLIVGKIRSGKTKLTAQILSGILSLVKDEEVTVIDLAPEKEGLGRRLT
ncbi:MAG: hypothetical protein NZ992_04480, partial [Candidatus Korarchaeum sp.]|nr:hypothetical protein [Candidatus Korarchaeum sp.]